MTIFLRQLRRQDNDENYMAKLMRIGNIVINLDLVTRIHLNVGFSKEKSIRFHFTCGDHLDFPEEKALKVIEYFENSSDVIQGD